MENNSSQGEVTALQREVDEWISRVGVRYFNELTNMTILSEEVGEVARIIARRYGEQSEKESDKGKDLGEELADVRPHRAGCGTAQGEPKIGVAPSEHLQHPSQNFTGGTGAVLDIPRCRF